jgi:hypothetical protein
MMSLRGAFAATWRSSIIRGDCFAIARNDMWAKVNALREFGLFLLFSFEWLYRFEIQMLCSADIVV